MVSVQCLDMKPRWHRLQTEPHSLTVTSLHPRVCHATGLAGELGVVPRNGAWLLEKTVLTVLLLFVYTQSSGGWTWDQSLWLIYGINQVLAPIDSPSQPAAPEKMGSEGNRY